MSFCKKCGKEMNDDVKFCPACGEPANNGASGSSENNSGNSSYANDAYQNAKSKVETVLNTKDTTGEYDPKDIESNKVICALAYIPILFFLPLVACPKTSKFAKFHANQGLLLLILSVVCNVVGSLIGLIPILGTIVWVLLELVLFAAFIFGLINTLQGKAKELPLIGGIRLI